MVILRYGNPSGWPDYVSAYKYERHHWPDVSTDVTLLHGILNGLGYDATQKDIEIAYAEYSEEEWCAGWLRLPTEKEHLQSLARHLVEKDYLIPE